MSAVFCVSWDCVKTKNTNQYGKLHICLLVPRVKVHLGQAVYVKICDILFVVVFF